ncbi:MAG: amidohydrolase [Deltaproteobacteria bacterium]
MTCIHFDPKHTPSRHTPSGKDLETHDYHDLIDKLADKVEDKVIAWRHDMHQNPELPNREFRTAKLIADHLKSLHFDEVRTKVGGTGVVGLLKGGQPGDKVVALRADFDALPVEELADVPFKSTRIDKDYPGGPFPVAHACGHECHATMLMGAAEVLAEMRDQIPGSVKFLFQGAEEGPPVGEEGGAAMMIKDGALDNPKPDVAFAIHTAPFPANTLYYCKGDTMAASELVKIEINGMGVHGSTPWMGKDPMTVAAEIILALGQIYRQVPATEAITISIGKVDDKGRFNIIGDNITLWGTARCVHQQMMEDVNMRIQRIVTNIAAAHGLTAEASFDQQVPATFNEPQWLDRFMPTMERIFGHDKMRSGPPMLAYDDHSCFQIACGGVYLFLGSQDTKWTEKGLEPIDPKKPIPFNHNPHYYVKDEVLKTGIRMHANVVMDFLNGKI